MARPFAKIRHPLKFAEYLLKIEGGERLNPMHALWLGPAAHRLPVGATLNDPKKLGRVFRGLHPYVGEMRLRPNRTACYGHELKLSAPKSVSLLWLIEPRVAEWILDAAAGAMRMALHVNSSARRCASQELMVGLFLHFWSREGDPHLHVHGVIPNFAFAPGGVWRAAQVGPMYKENNLILQAFFSNLAHSIVRAGHSIKETKPNGAWQGFELADISATFREAFSLRQDQVTKWLKENPSFSSHEIANGKTKPPKRAEPHGELRRMALKRLDDSQRAELARCEASAMPWTDARCAGDGEALFVLEKHAEQLSAAAPWLQTEGQLFFRVLQSGLGAFNSDALIDLFTNPKALEGKTNLVRVEDYWTSRSRLHQLCLFKESVAHLEREVLAERFDRDEEVFFRLFLRCAFGERGTLTVVVEPPPNGKFRYDDCWRRFRELAQREQAVVITPFHSSYHAKDFPSANHLRLSRCENWDGDRIQILKKAGRVVVLDADKLSLAELASHLRHTKPYANFILFVGRDANAYFIARVLEVHCNAKVISARSMDPQVGLPPHLSPRRATRVDAVVEKSSGSIATFRDREHLENEAALRLEQSMRTGLGFVVITGAIDREKRLTNRIREILLANGHLKPCSGPSSVELQHPLPRSPTAIPGTLPCRATVTQNLRDLPRGTHVTLEQNSSDRLVVSGVFGSLEIDVENLRHLRLFRPIPVELLLGDLLTPTCHYLLPNRRRLTQGCRYLVTSVTSQEVVLDDGIELPHTFLPLRFAYVDALAKESKADLHVRPRDAAFFDLTPMEIEERGGYRFMQRMKKRFATKPIYAVTDSEDSALALLGTGSDLPHDESGARRAKRRVRGGLSPLGKENLTLSVAPKPGPDFADKADLLIAPIER